MKVLVGVSRIFVGVLFIISGLIKLNDPVGFSFKLGDYFAPEVLNLPFLEPYALIIAVCQTVSIVYLISCSALDYFPSCLPVSAAFYYVNCYQWIWAP